MTKVAANFFRNGLSISSPLLGGSRIKSESGTSVSGFFEEKFGTLTGSISQHHSPTPGVGNQALLWELLHEPILQLDHLKLGEVSHPSIETRVRVATVFDVLADCAAKAFHRKRPIRPDRSSGLNPISDVKERVD